MINQQNLLLKILVKSRQIRNITMVETASKNYIFFKNIENEIIHYSKQHIILKYKVYFIVFVI